MKVKPIRPLFRTFDKDERHAAEERRVKLLLDLAREMDIPQERYASLMLHEKRDSSLRWLHRNLAVRNSRHKNFSRVKNLISLLSKKK
jgi:hypothetical protein